MKDKRSMCIWSTMSYIDKISYDAPYLFLLENINDVTLRSSRMEKPIQ